MGKIKHVKFFFILNKLTDNNVVQNIPFSTFVSLDQDDLWQALTEIAQESGALDSNQTLKEIMDSWTVKMGYPVVTVTRYFV
jgi:hypothetical protein